MGEPEWLTAAQWESIGGNQHGPEMDYGLRWGATSDIRVSYSPFIISGQRGRGRLYAYDPVSDRYAVLAPNLSAVEAEVTWAHLTDREITSGDLASVTRRRHARPEDTLRQRVLEAVSADVQIYSGEDRARAAGVSEEQLVVVHFQALPAAGTSTLDSFRPVPCAVAAADVDHAVSAVAQIQRRAESVGGQARIVAVSQGDRMIPVAQVARALIADRAAEVSSSPPRQVDM
jgi:hypothetical protein